MLSCKYVEEMGSAAMLATKRSVDVAPQVAHRPPPSANKATYPGFETQWKHHQKSKTGVLVAPQKRHIDAKTFFKNLSKYLEVDESFLYLTCRNKL